MTTVAFTKLYLGAIEETGRRDNYGRLIQRHAMFGTEDVRTTSPWDPDRPPLAGAPAGHRGHDWAPVPAGRSIDIRAYAPGVVQRLDVEMEGVCNGYAVVIRHGYPWWSFYLHLADDPRQRWSVGDEVKRGDLIGPMGTTGCATGIHLHHGVYAVQYPRMWGIEEPPGFFVPARSYPVNPALFYLDEPPAPPQPTDWMEPSAWGTQAEWEQLVGPQAYFDLGTRVGLTPGDLDARVKIEDDGIGLVEVAEIRRRL